MKTQEYEQYSDMLKSPTVCFDSLEEYTAFYRNVMKQPMLPNQYRTLSAIYNSHMMFHDGDTDDKVDRFISRS